MAGKRGYKRHDKAAVMAQAAAAGKTVYVFATALGYTISTSKPVGCQDYYIVNGASVELVVYTFN